VSYIGEGSTKTHGALGYARPQKLTIHAHICKLPNSSQQDSQNKKKKIIKYNA
jgi:hypothetical protein